MTQEKKVEDGGPAFPQRVEHIWLKDGREHGCNHEFNGLSLRDYFAAAILTGCEADGSVEWKSIEAKADYCYQMANAMLEARKK